MYRTKKRRRRMGGQPRHSMTRRSQKNKDLFQALRMNNYPNGPKQSLRLSTKPIEVSEREMRRNTREAERYHIGQNEEDIPDNNPVQNEEFDYGNNYDNNYEANSVDAEVGDNVVNDVVASVGDNIVADVGNNVVADVNENNIVADVNENMSNNSAATNGNYDDFFGDEEISNRSQNPEYARFFVKKSSKKNRQRKFRQKKKTCKHDFVLLDDPYLCEPILKRVYMSEGRRPYINLAGNQVFLGSSQLRGKYRNLDKKIRIIQEDNNNLIINANPNESYEELIERDKQSKPNATIELEDLIERSRFDTNSNSM